MQRSGQRGEPDQIALVQTTMFQQIVETKAPIAADVDVQKIALPHTLTPATIRADAARGCRVFLAGLQCEAELWAAQMGRNMLA